MITNGRGSGGQRKTVRISEKQYEVTGDGGKLCEMTENDEKEQKTARDDEGQRKITVMVRVHGDEVG